MHATPSCARTRTEAGASSRLPRPLGLSTSSARGPKGTSLSARPPSKTLRVGGGKKLLACKGRAGLVPHGNGPRARRPRWRITTNQHEHEHRRGNCRESRPLGLQTSEGPGSWRASMQRGGDGGRREAFGNPQCSIAARSGCRSGDIRAPCSSGEHGDFQAARGRRKRAKWVVFWGAWRPANSALGACPAPAHGRGREYGSAFITGDGGTPRSGIDDPALRSIRNQGQRMVVVPAAEPGQGILRMKGRAQFPGREAAPLRGFHGVHT